jgi:hypothetical protein
VCLKGQPNYDCPLESQSLINPRLRPLADFDSSNATKSRTTKPDKEANSSSTTSLVHDLHHESGQSEPATAAIVETSTESYSRCSGLAKMTVGSQRLYLLM